MGTAQAAAADLVMAARLARLAAPVAQALTGMLLTVLVVAEAEAEAGLPLMP